MIAVRKPRGRQMNITKDTTKDATKDTTKENARDNIVWPVNPNNTPRGIHVIWSISSLLLAIMGAAIGVMLLQGGEILVGVIVLIFAFFMVGGVIFQIKKTMGRGE
jgi:hypothetical protein